MNQASRLRVLLLLVVFVSGCGFTITAPRDYALGDEPKDGLVIVSFTQPPHERVFWMYRDLTKGKGIRNVYERSVSTGEHPDVSTPIITGDTRMIAVVLPQGDYEFYRWTARSHFGENLLSTKDFSVRFKSVAGRALYIGNLFVPMEGRRFRLLARDHGESEIPLFRKHYPKITDTQIETRLMWVIGFGEPLEASPRPLTALRAR